MKSFSQWAWLGDVPAERQLTLKSKQLSYAWMIWALVRRYDVSLIQKTVERSLVIGAWRAEQDTGILK